MTRQTKQAISWTAVFGIIPAGAVLTYVASGVIKAHSFEDWKEQRVEWGQMVVEANQQFHKNIEKSIDVQREHDQEWRVEQSQVNRWIIDRLDVILDRLPPRGHTDAMKPETEEITP